jgi:chromosomal replication initiation ATPase DnaA
VSRLDQLHSMRDFIDREIAAELAEIDDAVRADELVNAVATLYSVSVDEILLGDQRHPVARARRGLAWLLRRRGVPLRDVARMVGYGYEDTVSHACRRVDHDPAARALLLGLEAS